MTIKKMMIPVSSDIHALLLSQQKLIKENTGKKKNIQELAEEAIKNTYNGKKSRYRLDVNTLLTEANLKETTEALFMDIIGTMGELNNLSAYGQIKLPNPVFELLLKFTALVDDDIVEQIYEAFE